MIWNDDTEETIGICIKEKYGRSKIICVDIVRCKDCKNAEILPWLDNAIICKKHNYTGVRPDEFYCADGERRNDDG